MATSASPKQLKVFSLNCWGLKYIAKDLEQRVHAIANALANTDYDFIALQEIWVYAHYEHIRQAVAHKMPYSKFFYSGALGAGLALFTKLPILNATVHPYSLNGEPTDVSGGDWFVGKAAGSIVVQHPDLGLVQVFNTHLFAKGGEDGPEYQRAHRLVNAWELSKLMREAAHMGRYVIAIGDFNNIPTTLSIDIIREHANVHDSWAVSHPNPPSGSHFNFSPEEAISLYGVTADSPVNTYSAGKPLDPHARKYLGKRLDYVFYRQPVSSSTPLLQLKCSSCRVLMTEHIPQGNVSYSDHFALESVLDITPASEFHDDKTSSPSTESQISNTSLTATISALTSCYRFSRQRARNELIVFGLCVLLLVALCVGSAWIPWSWVNPIVVLLAALLTWTGTTMLYEGFLYGNWEQNALMNVIEEMEIILRANTS
jgi:sphingomyelin phosphodiesterase 2